jgi:long-chain acyl-CoA synthetase
MYMHPGIPEVGGPLHRRQSVSGSAASAAPALATLADLVDGFRQRGEGTAVVEFRQGQSVAVSYAALAAAIDRAAHALRERGVAHGDRVALWAPNGSDWIVAYFAIVAIGATAVPLDQQATSEQIAAALDFATPRLLITTRASRAELERRTGTAADVWLLDDDGGEGSTAHRGAGVSVGPRAASETIASLLFTSGTTGEPKAVPLTHANLVANLRELLATGLIGTRDRVLLPLPLHHTYPFTAGLLLTLATGATLVLPAGISGPEIVEACSQGRATAMLAVPRLCTALWDSVVAGIAARGPATAAIFHALLAASIRVQRATGLRCGKWLFRPLRARLGAALDLIGCGGAKLPGDLAWNLEGLGFMVLTGYGLTETSPVLTFNSRRHRRIGSEGRALPGVELRLGRSADETAGEILARGPSVFTGYWRNPSATAEAFTADGWFRTGDLGTIDAAGYLYVVGRSKELLVLADGKKFFPEPLEKTYAASPLLREIGVFERGGTLAAVVVPDEEFMRQHGALREAASLREALEEVGSRLPAYQRLSQYRVVRTPLPRTQLGKLRRHLLPALFDGALRAATGEAEPEPSAGDRALLASERGSAVWRWLVDRYQDHPLTLDTSPQLELGIDSLEWVAVTVEMERRFGVALRADRLSGILTLRDLLRELESAPAAAAHGRETPAFVPPGPLLRAFGAFVLATVRVVVRAALRLEVAGVERLPAGAMVVTPNHTSYLDPLVIAAALPWERLRQTYWAGWVGVMHTSRLRRLVSRAAQVFPVDPDRDLAGAVRTAQQLLAQGYSIVWFPEGRRSPSGALAEFQAGVGLLLQGKAHAVPTAIRGTFEAWPKHRATPRRGHAQVTFGAPLQFAAERSPNEIRRALHRAVAVLLGVKLDEAPTTDTGGGLAMPTSITDATAVTVRDGRRVTLRPIRRDDVARNAAFLDGLSAPSKHLLFLGGISRLSDDELRRLCDPDTAHDMAYVAMADDPAAPGGERQVGVCRYAGADAVHGAEISVAVADDWQHQGLGKLLLRRLIEYARVHGVRRLYSMDAVHNEAMRRLARDVGFVERPDPDDIHQVIYTWQPS